MIRLKDTNQIEIFVFEEQMGKISEDTAVGRNDKNL